MTIESASYPDGLNASNPASGDPRSEGDDHLRLLKTVLKTTFPAMTTRLFSTTGGLSGAQSLSGAASNTVLYRFTGNGTANLPAAATAGNGFMVGVYAPTGVSVSVDPDGSELVNGTGTITVSGALCLLFSTGSGWIATIQSVADTRMAGEIVAFAGSTLPTGWLWCDGSAINRSTFATLFAALGTAFGAGDGSTTFNLPDLRGRAPFGKDNMDNSEGTGGGAASRLTSAGSSVDGATLGATGGAQNVTLDVTTMPSHNHGGSAAVSGTAASDGAHTHGLLGGPDDASGTVVVDGFNISLTPVDSTSVTTSNGAHTHTVSGSATVSSQGGGGAHNNMPPAQVVNFIIKAT